MSLCKNYLRQFFIIFWKNLILQIRRPFGTFIEVSLPIAGVLLIVILRLIVFKAEDECFTVFQSDALQLQNTTQVVGNMTVLGETKTIFFTPNTTDHLDVMRLTQRQLNYTVQFEGVEDESTLVSQATEILDKTGKCANYTGVLLPANLADPDLTVTIRPHHEVGSQNTWSTSSSAPRVSVPGPRSQNLYTSEGFVQVQNAITQAILLWRLNQSGIAINESSLLSVSLKKLPYPKYTNDNFLISAISMLPLLIVLGFLYTAGSFIKELVLEKEARLRESMKMMGLKGSVLWCAWFVKQFLFLFVMSLVISLLLKFGRIMPSSDFILILIFMILFSISMISFGFLISAFFSSATISLFIGGLLWYITFTPYLFLNINYDAVPLAGKVVLCLISNTCVGLGLNTALTLESSGEGMTWSNIAQPLSNDDQFSIIIVFGMLILDSVLYIAIGWYKEGVFPGKYGVPKPFYFPFQPSYWLGRPLRQRKMTRASSQNGPIDEPNISSYMLEESGEKVDSKAHEAEPSDLRLGISITNLSKIFKTGRTKKKAVDKLNLNMYEGQITVLLGHNGAGKTTTMSILTGLFTPTSGDAVINDYSILTDMDTIRQNLGLCPQHNVLFDRLTVREHLNLFGRLKGFGGKVLKEEIDTLLIDLQLNDKRNTKAKELSGGMKRKLSVGIALVGGSQFVILDEPTSGMDPYARRATWDLLAKYKRNRTILLTTHFMDEADILGDRIAIMAEGKLLCSGSSLFLKGRYGIGYHLTLVKESHCDVPALTDMITTTVSGAEKTTDVAAELSFVLPSASTTQFPDLFTLLEDNKEKLGIVSYGLSVTTMEEVFMKVGEGVDETAIQRRYTQGLTSTLSESAVDDCVKGVAYQDTKDEDAINKTVGSSTNLLDLDEDGPTKISEDVEVSVKGDIGQLVNGGIAYNSGVTLWLQQYRAMFVKHVLNGVRHFAALAIQLTLPTLFVLLALIILKVTLQFNNDLTPDPARTLTVRTSAPQRPDTILFYADMRSETSSSLPAFFKNISKSDIGIAATENATSGINSLLDDVRQRVITEVNKTLCCQEENQILNQYCASIDLNQVCNSIDNFGYHSCSNCLSCCTSTSSQPSTCSKQGFVFNDRDVCPTPPRLAIGQSSYSSGPVDDITAFIAEHLLRSAGTNFDQYEREYQLGFTLEDEPFNPLEVCSDNSTALNRSIPLWTAVSELCSRRHANLLASRVYRYPENVSQPEGATVWYNNKNYHLAPAALSAFYNYYFGQLRSENPSWTNPLNSLTFVNHPLPRTAEGETQQTTFDFTGYSFAVTITFGLSFLLASFSLFIVQERTSKAKHLQFVGGVHTSSYWLATFSWDLLNSLPTIIIAVILVAAFQVEQLKGINLLAFFILLVLVCWSSIPTVYCFSFLFKSYLLAFFLAVALLYFIPLLLGIVRLLISIDNPSPAETLDYFFMIFPTYSFFRGIELIYTNEFQKELCTKSALNEIACQSAGIKYVNSVFDSVATPGLGAPMLFMACQGVIFFLLTLLIERSLFIPEVVALLGGSGRTAYTDSQNTEDDDVAAERRLINEGSAREDVISIRNLTKVYRGGITDCCRLSKRAVDRICLGVGNECFGLLGVNGAGKTTTFQILTGDLSPTDGTAVISGYDIKKSLRQVQQRIGYCPQFDALLERLTGVELLTMFARLRGVPEGMIPQLVQAEIKRLDLTKYAKKRSGTYSGGNKRKLSTAIALVGDTPIVLLDEPTTGMDPTTRRHLWDALTKLVKRGKSIVLTSHSMEECEALCTRLAIMVNGQFKCLGSIQHLKSKFGKGLTLVIKTSPTEQSMNVSNIVPGVPVTAEPASYVPDNLKRFINEAFPGSTLLEAHQCSSTFQLPSEGLSWAFIFQQIESNKTALSIQDYSVSQTTLEQVFVNFASEQLED